MTKANFGHEFTVSDISTRGKPVPSPVFNEFDSHGTLLGLPRLPEERNTSYKKRLLDVFTRRASSTYIGLINGITRELGLELYKPITITRATGLPVTSQPVISFYENKVIVYSDKATGAIELELDRSTPGSNAYWVGDFVTTLNSQSSYFTATLNSGQDPFTRTDSILNHTSSQIVTGFNLRPSVIQVLNHSLIERQSLVFSNRRGFTEEVSSDLQITGPGKYYVDYDNGLIQSYNIPQDGTAIRYVYHRDNYTPLASPVILRSLQLEDFKELLFLNTAPDGTGALGVPTDLGVTILNELLSVFPMYWGE